MCLQKKDSGSLRELQNHPEGVWNIIWLPQRFRGFRAVPEAPKNHRNGLLEHKGL